MGLDTTHGAFSGSYGTFNRFRQVIAKAWGASYPPHEDKSLDGLYVYFPDGTQESEGLVCLMRHSDCDGEISREDCGKIAIELTALLPKIKEIDPYTNLPISISLLTEKFIKGCEEAHKKNEPLKFM